MLKGMKFGTGSKEMQEEKEYREKGIGNEKMKTQIPIKDCIYITE